MFYYRFILFYQHYKINNHHLFSNNFLLIHKKSKKISDKRIQLKTIIPLFENKTIILDVCNFFLKLRRKKN